MENPTRRQINFDMLYLYRIGQRQEFYGPHLAVKLASEFNSGTLKEAVESVRTILESEEVVALIVEECCLLENRDDFNGDETFKFYRLQYVYGSLVYLFKNSEEDVVESKIDIQLSYSI